MKKILIIVISSLLFFLFFVATFPKENGYFFLEKKMLLHQLVISNEKTKEHVFSFELRDGEVRYKKQPLFVFEQIKLMTFLFFTKLESNNIALYHKKKSVYVQLIDKVKIKHHVLNPLFIQGEANGDVGELKFNIKLKERLMKIDLKPSRLMKKEFRNYLNQMKQDAGVYYYEYRF